MDQSEDEEPKGREAALPGVGGIVVPAMGPARSVTARSEELRSIGELGAQRG